ncbi:MAG: tetratricopeptide repeat protein, partial [Myxococcota bacterium]
GVGLRAYFMEASYRIVELQLEAEAIVKSGHITAVVATEKGLEALDFDRRLAGYRTMQVLDDVEALAHYHNNRGYELMFDAERHGQPIDWVDVAHEFFMATKVSPHFVRAENNLGIAAMRLGKPDEAEQHYLVAIREDPEFSTPYNNLGILYLHRGEVEKARAAFATAVRLDPENPYVRENQALALAASDIDNPQASAPPTLESVAPCPCDVKPGKYVRKADKKSLYPQPAPGAPQPRTRGP